MDKHDRQRLKDLDENIGYTNELIGDLERKSVREKDRLRRDELLEDIRNLEQRKEELQEKYHSLKAKAKPEDKTTLDEVAVRLSSIDRRLKGLTSALVELRWRILDRFDESDEIVIGTVVGRLSQQQLEYTERVLQAVDREHVERSEMEDVLKLVTEEFSKITVMSPDQRIFEHATAVANAPVVGDPTADMVHKLKVVIPIIPFVLSYQTELGIKQSVNLNSLWQRITGWFG